MHADKKKERGLHVAIPAAIGVIGYALLYALRHQGSVAMYIAACITVTGVFSHIPAMLSWFGNNIGGHTKRGVASAIIISIGNVGGAIGGQIYRANDAPLYATGNLAASDYYNRWARAHYCGVCTRSCVRCGRIAIENQNFIFMLLFEYAYVQCICRMCFVCIDVSFFF